MNTKINAGIAVAVIIIIAVAVLIVVRVYSEEDRWVCVDGNWVKRGFLLSAKPEGECRNKNSNDAVADSSNKETNNGKSGSAVYDQMAAEGEKSEISGIEVFEPKKDGLVKSPLIIKGKAKGNWFFEAEFLVKLMDGNGKEISQSIAKAEGEWMIEDFVPFSATIKFNAPRTSNGFIVFSKNNPSGMPANDYSTSIEVRFK
jgi:hypothetical protein